LSIPVSAASTALVDFYLGHHPDSEGRYLSDIWAWDNEDLECAHDYIQWLLPLAEPSAYNATAPLLDGETIQAFKQTPQLQRHLITSYQTLLRFYGLQQQEHVSGPVVTSAEDYPARAAEWVQPLDHNHLRITRILKCLTLLGCSAEARAFYQCLQQIYREHREAISPVTFQYWTAAIAPPDPSQP